MNNFKKAVPAEVKIKIKALAELFESEWDNIVVRRVESMGDVRLSEIEGNYVSGWLPRQDGGFEVSQFVCSDIDSSYHVTEKQTDWVNDQSNQCMVAFIGDNGLDGDVEWDGLTEDQKEAYSEYERDWFSDGALLGFQIYANGYPSTYFEGEKEQTVIVRSFINYKDGPYFREKSAEDIKEVIFEVSEFLSTDNNDIIKQFTI